MKTMISINYHPSKANIVADALSQSSERSLAIPITQQSRLLRDLKEMGIEAKLRDFTNSRG